MKQFVCGCKSIISMDENGSRKKNKTSSVEEKNLSNIWPLFRTPHVTLKQFKERRET